MRRADACEGTVRIALVGKYVQLADAYKSVIEALNHGGYHHGVERRGRAGRLRGLRRRASSPAGRRHPDPGRLRRARDRGQDRGRADRARAAASRTWGSASACRSRSPSSPATSPAWTAPTRPSSTPRRRIPVVDLLPEQKEVSDMGGTMRLGADPVKLHDGTRAREIFGEAVIYKRHRHRYEVNNQLRRRLEDEGLVAGGTSPDERLVEIDRAARPPVLRRLAVPPGVQLAPQPARAALPRVRRRGGRARAGSAATDPRPRRPRSRSRPRPTTCAYATTAEPGEFGRHVLRSAVRSGHARSRRVPREVTRVVGPFRRQLGARARLPLVGDGGSGRPWSSGSIRSRATRSSSSRPATATRASSPPSGSVTTAS